MIKKCLATAFVLFVFIFWHNVIFGMDWITANQVTLTWRAVTTMEDGSAIPEGDVVTYEVFLVPKTGDKIADRILKVETIETEATLTFDLEGLFFLGVRAVRSKAGTRLISSKVSWTDNPGAVMDGLTQGVIFFRVPANPLDLEIN
ncbi:hypothetical protein ES702_05046 [subsurface metagenome]